MLKSSIEWSADPWAPKIVSNTPELIDKINLVKGRRNVRIKSSKHGNFQFHLK